MRLELVWWIIDHWLCSFTGIANFNPNMEETEIEHMIKVAQLLIADLRKGLDLYHTVFKE